MHLTDQIFNVTDTTFEQTALAVFNEQYTTVEVYRQFCDSLRRTPHSVKTLADIPFLPVEFFKTHTILAEGKQGVKVFESSGTTGAVTSRHYVADTGLYERSFMRTFQQFYGKPEEYVILGLLPSYLERGNSSLVYMADYLVKASGRSDSGFFLNEFSKLKELLLQLKGKRQRTLLLGVTFALLDFAESFALDFPELIVMETGGMKGRRKEMTREEVHEILYKGFGVSKIHSEYGMTELLSQGYSKGGGIFNLPAWMKIVVREPDDPLRLQEVGKVGAINIIDLANLYSCAFIATSDVGRINEDGSFEVRGRMDNSDIRGCNLMVV